MKNDFKPAQNITRNEAPTIFDRSCMNLVINLFNKIETGGAGQRTQNRHNLFLTDSSCETTFAL